MKRIDAFQDMLLEDLDNEYKEVRDALAGGFSPEQYNKNGGKRQSVFLNAFKRAVEEIQDVNRLNQRLTKKKPLVI